jgi:hypothetical protein
VDGVEGGFREGKEGEREGGRGRDQQYEVFSNTKTK